MLDDVKISMQKFGWPDYLVFVVMLVICALIGVYFGFIEKKPAKKCDEESDYLVGGRQMKVVPIVMSLIARYVCPKDCPVSIPKKKFHFPFDVRAIYR